MENKKRKYSDYYKSGKVNIINFINGLNTKDLVKLKELYKEICEEEKGLLIDLELQKQKLQLVRDKKKDEQKIKGIEFDIDWFQNRIEFVRIKKDVVSREIQDIENQKGLE